MAVETGAHGLGLSGASVVAWGVGLACALIALRQFRRSASLDAPDVETLQGELRAALGVTDLSAPEPIRRAAIAELNQRLSDVAFELGGLPARWVALTRISLASGTASALFGYIGSSARSPVERVVGLLVCMAGGAVGAAFVLAIGRMAKPRSARIRARWDRVSRETGKVLGTSLEQSQGMKQTPPRSLSEN